MSTTLHRTSWTVDKDYLARLRSTEEKSAVVRHCPKTGSEITLSYQTFGNPTDPCVLLVMGLNGQAPLWDLEFCETFASKGYFVVRYDNRDVGLSTKLDKCGSPGLFKLLTRGCCGGGVPYLLIDMAADAMGLLDHLGVTKAHVVGISMGGMLVQTMAIEFPHRVATMTSIASTTGGPKQVDPSLSMKLFLSKKPKSDSDHDLSEYRINFVRRTGGPRPFNEDKAYTRGIYLSNRSRYVDGMFRHAGAIVFSPPRHEDLSKVKVPALVIHGDKDELVPTANGYQTHQAIPGSRLVIIPEMGHIIFEEDVATIINEVDAMIKKEAARAQDADGAGADHEPAVEA